MEEFIRLQRERLASEMESIQRQIRDLNDMMQKAQLQMHQLILAEQQILGRMAQLNEVESQLTPK